MSLRPTIADDYALHCMFALFALLTARSMGARGVAVYVTETSIIIGLI